MAVSRLTVGPRHSHDQVEAFVFDDSDDFITIETKPYMESNQTHVMRVRRAGLERLLDHLILQGLGAQRSGTI